MHAKEDPVQPGAIDNYRTKQELAYITLKQAIISNALPPGTRLVIRELASRLGVSETPVRGALTQLTAEGLANSISHAGAVVSPLQPTDIEDLYAAIGAIQGLAAERAAVKITPEGVARLAAKLEELDNLPESASFFELSSLNHQFHHTISEISGAAVFIDLTDSLFDRYQRTRIAWTIVPHHRERARSEHRQILEALQDGLPDRARALMEDHWRRSAHDFVLQIQTDERGRRIG